MVEARTTPWSRMSRTGSAVDMILDRIDASIQARIRQI